MKIKALGILALAGLLLAGCTSAVHVERDQTVNFNSFRSYAWVEAEAAKGDSARVKPVSDLQERMIRQAVDAELARTGWKESKKPDVLIAYDVLVERGVRESANPVYSQPFVRPIFNPYTGRWMNVFYPSRFMGYDRNMMQVREGTITISLIDARTEKTIWQGWTTEEISSRNMTTKELQSAVRNIFRKFDLARN